MTVKNWVKKILRQFLTYRIASITDSIFVSVDLISVENIRAIICNQREVTFKYRPFEYV